MQGFTWTCNPELCLTAVDPKEGQAAPSHKWATTATVSRSHRPPWERTQCFSMKPHTHTQQPQDPLCHCSVLPLGVSKCPRQIIQWSSERGFRSDWCKWTNWRPQEGPGQPLHMLKVVNFKTSPYRCLLTLFLAHCCRAPDTPLQ